MWSALDLLAIIGSGLVGSALALTYGTKRPARTVDVARARLRAVIAEDRERAGHGRWVRVYQPLWLVNWGSPAVILERGRYRWEPRR